MPSGQIYRRTAEIRAEALTADTGDLNILASTSDPVNMGGWREVLSHDANCVDMSTASALLINHNPDQIAGPVRNCAADGKVMRCVAQVLPGAKLESGITVREAIACGALRGVSIGYTYANSDTVVDQSTRTVTVNKWRLLEVSLTPIPADATAAIQRSFPGVPMPEIATPDHSAELAALKASNARLEVENRVRALAGEHGVDAKGLDFNQPEAALVGELLKRKASAERSVPAAAITPATIGWDEADKNVAAIGEAFAARCGVGEVKAGNPYAGRSLCDIARKYGRTIGLKTEDWTKRDIAHFILGERDMVAGMRDAANVTTSNFSTFVFLNAITKIVAKGFESSAKGLIGASGAPIYDTQTVPDFKQFTVGGLGIGNLQETAENIAFPELTKTEGAYNSTAKMWGGTMSLTLQALISDDTAAFERGLRQAGAIAQKTIDRRMVQKFLRGIATTDASTWTSNTTSGCTPVWTTSDTLAAARKNIGLANAALQVKVGLDGNPIGNMGRFLFAPPTAGLYLAGLLNQAPGQTVANTGNFELVVSPWLESSGITGNSTTSYYVIADPALVTGLMLSKISGYESPQVQEYDAGAVGARKWKIWMPFEADLFWDTNAAGTSVIPAAQQATT
jgi:hypothetical protein